MKYTLTEKARAQRAAKTPARAEAARENAKKAGRPRGEQPSRTTLWREKKRLAQKKASE